MSTKLNLSASSSLKDSWGDMLPESNYQPAAAGAGTPQPKKEEDGGKWTLVNAPKNGKKTVSKTANNASASVARKLTYSDEATKKGPAKSANNSFAALADDSGDESG